jgi:cell filamentation protein, protein adenylyltransferase
MFQPQVQFTHNIADSLSRIEEMRRLINTLAVLPHWELSIRREALVNTVHSTTAIEGNRLSREQVERIVDGMRPVADARDTAEVRNVIALMKELYGMAREEVPADERLIREMNRRVLDNVPGALNPGEYRRGQNYVQDNLTGGVVFTPPDQGDVPALMAGLSDWLKLEQTGLSPVLKAGVAHLELVAVHPFWDGNGRVGRALATYVMYSTGYDFRRFHSWETYLNADVKAYTSVIAASVGDHYHAPRDYTPWLEYFTQALAVTLEGLRQEIESLRHAWDAAYAAASRLGLDQTQVHALIQAAFYGSVSTDAYREATGISRATAFRHLRELEGSGLIARVGRGRATHYVPAAVLLAPSREPIS